MLRNSPLIIFPQASSKMAPVMTKLLQTSRMWLSFLFLLQGFFPRSVLKLWRIRAALMRISRPNYTLRWTLSFPNFHVTLRTLWELHAVYSGPKDFGPFYVLEHPDKFLRILQFSNKTFTTSIFCRADCQALCAWRRTFQRIPIVFRDIDKTVGCQKHMTGSCTFHWRSLWTVFEISFQKDCHLWELFPFEDFPVALSLWFWSKRGRLHCFSACW